jgi:hypothetical protein
MLNALASVLMMFVCVDAMVTPIVSGVHLPPLGVARALGTAFCGFFLALLLLASPRWVELNVPAYRPPFFWLYQQRGLFVCLPAVIHLTVMEWFPRMLQSISEHEGVSRSLAFQDRWGWLFALIAVASALMTIGATVYCLIVVGRAYHRATAQGSDDEPPPSA